MTEHLGEFLSALADGELEEAEAAAARAHLAGCGMCTAELRAVESTRSMVRSLPPVEPLLPLTAVPSAPRRVSRLAGVLAAAAASVAMLLLSSVQQDGGTNPHLAQLVQAHTISPVNADLMSQVAPAALPVSFDR